MHGNHLEISAGRIAISLKACAALLQPSVFGNYSAQFAHIGRVQRLAACARLRVSGRIHTLGGCPLGRRAAHGASA
jgi:hypothetical protein